MMLVANHVRRTYKFLQAVCLGLVIVTSAWMEATLAAGEPACASSPLVTRAFPPTPTTASPPTTPTHHRT
jgi:hypothetical protein